MKFNLDVVIPEVTEQYSHGVLKYNEVKLHCRRSTDEVIIEQKKPNLDYDYLDTICMTEEQAEQLYLYLKSVFE